MSLQTPQYPGLNPDANRGPQINAVAITFLCFSFVVLVFRFISRVYTRVAIGTDDWLIVAAAVFAWCFTILCLVNVQDNHYGQHIGKASAQDTKRFLQLLYYMAITYCPALTLSKLSLLALYWRIFRVSTARRPMQIAAALNIGWGIAAGLVCIFPCRPIRGFWDFTTPSKCIDYNIFYTSNQAIAIALDIVVLFMPIYFISNLQQSLSQRISISSTFLLGLVVTLVQGLRLWRLVLAQRLPGPDPTFTEVDAGLWAILELNLWVIVASIPALRPLIRKILHERLRNSTPSHSQQRGISKSSAGSFKPKSGFFDGVINSRLASDPENTDEQFILKMEEGVTSRPWSKSKSKYDVRVSAPARQESGWTPLVTQGDNNNATEMDNLNTIRVDREVEVLRPKEAYRSNRL
ncbi:hypothetical protein P7C71_g1495, partial [Lecanoromycetidae sp. Uapishka_2]